MPPKVSLPSYLRRQRDEAIAAEALERAEAAARAVEEAKQVAQSAALEAERARQIAFAHRWTRGGDKARPAGQSINPSRSPLPVAATPVLPKSSHDPIQIMSTDQDHPMEPPPPLPGAPLRSQRRHAYAAVYAA